MRPQKERVATFRREFDRIAAKYEIGHVLSIIEIMVDGQPVLCTLANQELGGAPGIYGLSNDECRVCGRTEAQCKQAEESPEVIGHEFQPAPPVLRAEEMVMQIWSQIIRFGFSKIEPGKDFVVPDGMPQEVENIAEYHRQSRQDQGDTIADGLK